MHTANTSNGPTPKVVLSNGYHRYHLSAAAAELAKLGNLHTYLTGAYPRGAVKGVLAAAPALTEKFPRLKRLVDREESLDPSYIHSYDVPEYLNKLAETMRSKGSLASVGEWLRRYTHRTYGRWAASIVAKAAETGANMYHVRTGFGGPSIRMAREKGMGILCDHTIAHPTVLLHMIDNGGAYPPKGTPNPTGYWAPVLEDLDQTDFVLTNSDFVKDTFVYQGWEPDRIFVIYQGLDEKFAALVPPTFNTSTDGPLRLLFAGTLKRRKGIEELIAALSPLKDVDWKLTIAGGGHPSVFEEHKAFFANPRVDFRGTISRQELAQAMADSEIFIFPTLAEGSARVIFEAMACGMYVITTPNAGSVVQDGVHGSIIQPGDVASVTESVRHAASIRKELADRGAANAEFVKTYYMQKDFGQSLVEVYQTVLSRGAHG